jgi:hypothetical protein
MPASQPLMTRCATSMTGGRSCPDAPWTSSNGWGGLGGASIVREGPIEPPASRSARPATRPGTLLRHAPARGRQRQPHGPGAARPQGRHHDDDLHPRPEPRPSRRPVPRQSLARRLTMRSQALLGRGLTSPTCRHDANSLPPARAIRLVRLTPSRAARGARGISCAGGTLRRSQAHFQPTLGGRPLRRVRGIYAGLSNTRWASNDK